MKKKEKEREKYHILRREIELIAQEVKFLKTEMIRCYNNNNCFKKKDGK